MSHLYTVVKDGRLAENHILRTDFVPRHDLLAVVEPYEVHDAGTVGEVCHDAHLPWSHLKLLETQDASHNLHERHVTRQFMDSVYPRTVYMFIREVLQQVSIRFYTQFLTEYLLAVGAYARQVHDVLLQNVHY